MKSLKTRAVVYGLVILIGLLCAVPNLLPAHVAAKLPTWYTDTTLSLGLDLQGGSHLLLTADNSELVSSEYQTITDELVRRLREAGVKGLRPKASATGVQLISSNAEQLARLPDG